MHRQLVPSVKNSPHHLNPPETVMIDLIAGELRHHIIIGSDLRVIDLLQKTPAFKAFRNRNPHILQNQRRKIDVAHRIFIHSALGHSRPCNQKRNPGHLVVHHRSLGIKAMALQGIPMVRSIDYQRVRGITGDALQHPPKLRVRKGITAQKSRNFDPDLVPITLPILSRPDLLILGLSLQRVPYVWRLGKFIVLEHGSIGFWT